MRRHADSRLILSLAALAAAGCALWWAWSAEIDVSPLPPPAVATGAAAEPARSSGPGHALSPLSAYAQTTARPLFSADRRPPRAAAVVLQPPPHPPAIAGLRLLGVLKAPGGAARALLASRDDPAGRWHGVGDDIGGWRIAAIADAEVQIEAGSSRRQLQLYAPAAGLSAAPPRSDASPPVRPTPPDRPADRSRDRP